MTRRRRWRRLLLLADKHTLLRLMSDSWYQQTKLGAAFSPAQQQRSNRFWKLAADYLEQPLPVVMLAGMSLRAEADALWQQKRQQLPAKRRSAPAAPPSPQPTIAVAHTPAAAPALPASEAEQAAAGGGNSSSEKRLSKKKRERCRHYKAAADDAGQAAEPNRRLQAPCRAVEPQQQLSNKRRRREAVADGLLHEAAADGMLRIPAALPAPSQPATVPHVEMAEAAADNLKPLAKKKRQLREAGPSQPAATDGAPRAHLAAAASKEPQEQHCSPFSGAFAVFRPQEQAPPAAASAGAETRPRSARRRWHAAADAELLQLEGSAESGGKQRLGSPELDWEALGCHFGRSGSAVQRRFNLLRRAGSDAQAGLATDFGGQRAALPRAKQRVSADDEGTGSQDGAQQLVSGSSSAAAGQSVQIAVNFGLPPAAERHESPPFVGVTKYDHSRRSCSAEACIGGNSHYLATCASRAAAAAAHDVAFAWASLHSQGRSSRGVVNYNFPQLLEDEGLKQQLQALPDMPALQAFLSTWLKQQWPQMEAEMLAGRAAALSRYIASTCKRMGVHRFRAAWCASIKVSGKACSLGSSLSEDAAALLWDAANVWRSLHGTSAKASKLYNFPQLRLWEDAELLASLQGIQSREQLQACIKAWAKQHLPAKLAQLAQLRQGPASAGAAV